ncbi:hypothetical protein LT85_0014 [Collimonas arenae]|uniref:Uncharacterized protein n=1 Tax=Collimonas arenae TaxID=279058 RepID=A0A0A1F655_9BURK|nr:hypothetical protein LT85_0014 [Collimonas arenae]
MALILKKAFRVKAWFFKFGVTRQIIQNQPSIVQMVAG